MDDREFLAQRFDEHRAHLQAVAVRMLGSNAAAEDAVQEAWIRLDRSDAAVIDNLGGWLTTVVGRVCLDMLRARGSRREDALDGPEVAAVDADPADDAVLADSVGLAMLVVLDTLSPAERVAFVLHDTFGVPFDEVAAIVGRSPEATRQLASRARNRVRGARASGEPDLARQREIVDAFLAAARGGDMDALLRLLAPDVVLTADATAVATGADAELRGAAAVAGTFAGRARVAVPVLVDGHVGLAWAPGGEPRVVFDLTIDGDVISRIELVADAERLAAMELAMLGQ